MIRKTFACAGVLLCCTHAGLQAQPLFTYGRHAVSSQDFLRAFDKNPGEGDRRKALEEYLPLYINYRLKVQDAYDKRLDTLKQQREELAGFRRQLAESFLNDKAGADALSREALIRGQQEILLGHLYIAHGGDTAAAGRRARQAYADLNSGKPWADVVRQYGTDADAAAAGGVAGWITPFVLPYAYETAVYNLRDGGFTAPMPASEGVHIFSRLRSRPARGQVSVAQILLARYASQSPQEDAANRKLADSIYNALINGADFLTLAAQYSQDQSSRLQGGRLQPFTTGAYDPVFEDSAFALSETRRYARPFATSHGWHVLQYIDRIPPASPDDADALRMTRQRVINEGRLNAARQQYVRSKLGALGYKPSAIPSARLQAFTDAALANQPYDATGLNEKSVLFHMAGEPVTMADWIAYVRVQQNARSGQPLPPAATMLDDYVMAHGSERLMEQLDKLEPEFALQLRDFTDANLLFEAMDRNVWSKAAMDTVALEAYYRTRPDKYLWGPSAQAVMVTCSDTATLRAAQQAISARVTDWRLLNEQFPFTLVADSNRYDYAMLPLPEGALPKAGSFTPVVHNELDGSYLFAYIIAVEPEGGQRSFADARGLVMNDYQAVLEAQWLAALKKKYPVKINEAVWKQLLSKGTGKQP